MPGVMKIEPGRSDEQDETSFRQQLTNKRRADQFRQLRHVRRDPSRLIFAEQLGGRSPARTFWPELVSLIMKQLPLSSTMRRALGPMGRKAMMEWFYRKTSIAGVQIPNWILAIVAVVVLWIIYSAFIQ